MKAIDETYSKLIVIKDDILSKIDEIYKSLEPCLSLQNGSEIIHKDIRKIYEGNRLLDSELKKLLDERQLSKYQGSALVSYLAKVRHALRNPINIIQGYAEIVLEELKHQQPFQHSNKILEVVSICNKILASIDTLQYSRPDAQSISEEESGEVPETEEYQEFKKTFSILVVDDDIENCRILERYLKRFGFRIVNSVTNGYKALSLKDEFHLILLDINMPGISGIEVLQKLQGDIKSEKVMVLMISATDTMANVIQCLTMGAEDFIQKPFKPELLRIRIRSCVQKKLALVQKQIYNKNLELERMKYAELLHAVFPPAIVEQLSQSGIVPANNYQKVAIVFADVVNFTSYCDTHSPNEVINNLQELAELSEEIATKHNVQKIKTIGDCFLGVSGLLQSSSNPVLDCVRFSQELIKGLEKLNSGWQLRVGINYGDVIGGIVGHRQYLFDIWGDTVNTASRIQGLAKPNTVYLNKIAWEQILDKDYRGKFLGEHPIKGKKPVEVYTIE